MKKWLAGFVKLLTLLSVLAAAAYAVVLYWDKIEGALERLKNALANRKDCYVVRREEDDYADWDECC